MTLEDRANALSKEWQTLQEQYGATATQVMQLKERLLYIQGQMDLVQQLRAEVPTESPPLE